MNTAAAAVGITLDACLGSAVRQLQATSDSARLDAELLLAHTLGVTRTQLRLRGAQLLTAPQANAFADALARRINGEPIAYILGEQEFWSLRFAVSPAVLVPRPETELLVEWALECMRENSAPAIADLGTGSGAIALALAHERGDAQIVAVDASAAALAVAQSNAKTLQLGQVQFRLGDWLVPLADETFDLLLSNPPYVAEGDEHLAALRHEPITALTAGVDGYAALKQLVDQAPRALRAGGWLLLEHGATQAAGVRALLAARGFADIETRRDLAGLERATGARWNAA